MNYKPIRKWCKIQTKWLQFADSKTCRLFCTCQWEEMCDPWYEFCL